MPGDESAAERTEDATPRKRQQARERGNLARSQDLSAAVVVFVAVLFLRYGGEWLAREALGMIVSLLDDTTTLPVPPDGDMLNFTLPWTLLFVRCIAPFLLLLFAVAAAAGFAQVGFVASWESLALKFEKLNPVAGFLRLFSLRSFVTLAMNLGKVAVVVAVAYGSVRDELAGLAALVDVGAAVIAIHIIQAALDLAVRLAAVLLVLALLDMWYQRFQWERDLRMTKQEMKEEMRDTEGDPHVRSRRRAIQRQLAMQRMMQEVPKAEVVVRNPTHFAAALAYDPERDDLPRLVAKGVDKVALRIIKVAVEHNVPVRYQPVLARSLCQLEIGDKIPESLWHAVIETLSWVYKGERGAKARRSLADAERRARRATSLAGAA